jgi:hypothetical protein
MPPGWRRLQIIGGGFHTCLIQWNPYGSAPVQDGFKREFLHVNTVAMLGMVVIMYRKYKTHRSSLIKAFYRDGIGYFFFLSGKCRTHIVIFS